MAKEPKQNRGKSKQDYRTPVDLLDAVVARFGPMDFDLAASAENSVVRGRFYSVEENSLLKNWGNLSGNLWLNPPFADIKPWARKCAAWAESGLRIFLLTPASVGSNWFREYVEGTAHVLALSPRIRFVGQKQVYPKDCLLSVYGGGNAGQFETWRWKP